MFNIPDDKYNIKYELALIDLKVMNGEILSIKELDTWIKLDDKLKDIEATEAIMEAVYET